MPNPEMTMSVRDCQALALRLGPRPAGGSLAGQVSLLEDDARTAARLIRVLLRHVNPSDVFTLPEE